jgi:hypothetical protein
MRTMKPFALPGVVLAAVFLLAFSAAAQEPPVLISAADRLCDLQADTIGDNANNGLIDTDPDDGGWDWDFSIAATEHSANPSPDNLYGVTALGIAAFIDEGTAPHDPRFITALFDAYLGIDNQPAAIYAPDIVYLARMTNIDPNKNYGFANLARTRYDARVASYGGPAALAQYLADRRGQSGADGLVPWDLGWIAEAAIELDVAFPSQGYFDDAKLYAHTIAHDIYNPAGYFQIDDPKEQYYTLGLAAVGRTMTLTGVDPALRNDAYARLAGMQKISGAYQWNGPNRVNNYQATAYAIKAWHAVRIHPHASVANKQAVLWLVSRQTSFGGWEYSNNRECGEVDGEILTALSMAMMGRGKLMLSNAPPPPETEAEEMIEVSQAFVHANARPLSF